MLLTSCTGNGGVDSRLHYASSKNGGDLWSVQSFIIPKVHAFEEELQYRASLLPVQYVDDVYEMWYSARGDDKKWKIAYQPLIMSKDIMFPLSSIDWKVEKQTRCQ